MADTKNRKQSYIFIPRSITHKQKTGSKHIKGNSEITSNIVHSKVNKDEDNSASDEVKKYSLQQRWPSAEEPICVICKRYGEYICDETDEDVCSLECKTAHLDSLQTPREKTTKSNEEFSLNEPGLMLQETFDSFYSSNVFYCPSKEIEQLGLLKISTFREKFKIRTKGAGVPKLILNFNHCTSNKKLLENLKENGFLSPTPVQMQVIPSILCGNDVLVSAYTSSGKTASFILPIIQKISSCLCDLPSSHEYCKYPIALVLTPTRELAIQIEEVAKSFCKELVNLKTALIIGGVPIPHQLHRLRHKIQLVIGTPGRINAILQNHDNVLVLKQVKMVVIDEADVMLEMGFQNQIHSIVDQVPFKTQLMMFSATIPGSIEILASKMMSNPILISVGQPGLTNQSVKQILLWVEEESKKKKLFSIIDDSKHFLPPVLVFVESKAGADLLCAAISEKFVIQCESIHSDKSQADRNRIMQDFLAGTYDILVSTNVMGRGLNLHNVRQVILFDMPNCINEYIHQVGRAGGLDSLGFVISFINNTNNKIFLDLKSLFDLNGIKLPEQLLNSLAMKRENGGRGKKKKLKDNRLSLKKEEINQQNLLQILTKNKKCL